MRFGLTGDRQHLFRYGHFKVHTGIKGFTQNADITIGDMAAIFTQVDRNAIRPRLLGDKSGLNRIGVSRTARVT